MVRFIHLHVFRLVSVELQEFNALSNYSLMISMMETVVMDGSKCDGKTEANEDDENNEVASTEGVALQMVDRLVGRLASDVRKKAKVEKEERKSKVGSGSWSFNKW